MAILTFPTQLPTRSEFQLISNTKSFRSPLDGSVQTSENPGARWHASLSFPNSSHINGRIMMAFLTSLRGESGRFYLYDQSQPTPRGTVSGSPIISGAGQVGTTVNTSGWSGTLLVGDMIGIGGELKMVTADATGSNAVPVPISFEPALRRSPVNGAPIITNKPTSVFKLTSDNFAKMSVASMIYNLHITCEEVF